MSKYFSSLPYTIDNSCLGCGERICICDENGTFVKPIIKHSIQKKNTKGDPGEDGAPGPPGTTGATGTTGTTGANGHTGANGAIGATGSTGVTGANGAIGATGVTGATGAPGKNSSEIIIETMDILIPTGINFIKNYDTKEYHLPNPDAPSKLKLELVNKETRPVVISTKCGSFVLSSTEYTKSLVFLDQWRMHSGSSFFPTKKKNTIEVHKNIKSVALSKNGDKIIVISNTPMVYNLKTDKTSHITNVESPQFAVISENARYTAISVKETVSFLGKGSTINESTVFKTKVYANDLYEYTLDGFCEKINNYFMLMRSGDTLKTINLDKSTDIKELDVSYNNLNANCETLAIANKSKVQIYTLSDNKWVMAKQLVNPESENSNPLVKISTDSQILAVATESKNNDGVDQKIMVYKHNGISYVNQTVLTFADSPTTDRTPQFFELSDNGTVIAWCNSKNIHIVVKTGDKWHLTKSFVFPTLVLGLNLSGDGKILVAWSNEIIQIYS